MKKIYNNIKVYCLESYDELVHKCSWPSYKELTNSALIVLSASIIIALVVFAMDSLFEQIMKLVYSFV